MRILSTSLLVSAAIASAALAQGNAAPFTVTESGRAYASLGDALRAIGDGRGTIMVAPGTYHQCAVQQGGDVTIRAATPGTAIFDGVPCEGKGALVLRGRSSMVDGIIFQNIRVPDGNGAGIRLESGNLTVRNSLFRNSEEGILTGDYAGGQVVIDKSTFRHLGRCDRDLDCAHGIYIGRLASLSVTNSRFDAGDGGHYLKTRTARVAISGNSFDDSGGTLTNYMIDLSNGATGAITGNEMVQGKDKDNWSAFITIAPEGREHSSAGLVIEGNKAGFVPGLARGSTFVANFTDDPVKIGANDLAPSMKVKDRR
ncbi:right-handed parallel beta-helix repeat-containing protein [Sphingobium sp. CAP-1]|uniref:right-handed parallel beta-helix repeat-containing protein n=1 Tax=Sphingobium sp. CAP-1 TaxID=2676077 RepID=UPI0012BB3193|nr:right-handed parallel beta-helix repeat-containing protein [Sphingobium sp. CAP-1]QGP78989.1 right-handed parallel beta-helix repeat-containing protein [Sphingobium sp. CAP-1]